MKQRMKTIGVILTTMVFMMFLSENMQAQDQRLPHRPPMLPDSAQVVKMVDQMAEELSLSDAQTTTLVKINLEHFKKIKPIFEKDKAEREATREKLEAMRKLFEDQMASVLNDKQKEQFKQFLKEHRPPHDRGSEHE